MTACATPVRELSGFVGTVAAACCAFLLALAQPAEGTETAADTRIATATARATRAAATPASAAGATTAGATPFGLAIVVRDQTPLRAAPRESAQQQAVLWQGDVVELRGARLDHLQVWDHRRERGGFIEASRLRRLPLTPDHADELLAIVRFVRDTPGAEALGIGYAAAYLKAASPAALRADGGAEAFEAIGMMAERLAERASAANAPAHGAGSGALVAAAPSRADLALAAHLEVAANDGVVFSSYERDGAMRLCYDGDAFRRVLALPGDAPRHARAALALTRPECIDPQVRIVERQRLDEWRAEVLDGVAASELAPTLRNRLAMRQAGVWSALAFARGRRGDLAAAQVAAERALTALASVERGELADADQAAYNDAAIRVSASRWAAAPPAASGSSRGLRIATTGGEPGQTCVLLVDAAHDAAAPLVRRCTFGLVWAGSASVNREGSALALAVQPMAAWRELWIFRRQGQGGWSVQVLPPSSASPELGYAEFAGWVPGGRQLLVAREARSAGRLKRSFEVMRLDTLATERQASDPAALGPFQRWQDPAWKRETVSLR